MAEPVNPAPGNEKLFPALKVEAPKTEPAKPVESKNVFTELFGKDVSQKDAGLMNTVAQKQEKKGVSFFGGKPKTDEISKLKAAHEHPRKPGTTFLKASVLLFFLVLAGFLTQNSARFSIFGTNPGLQVELATEQVNELEAEVRVQEHIAAALLLDQYSSLFDEYSYNVAQAESDYSSENKKAEYEAEAEALKPELVALLQEIQGYLSEEIPNEEVESAKNTLGELMFDLTEKSTDVDAQTLLQELQDLETAKVLMLSQDFKSYVSGLNAEEASDEDLEKVYDDFSTINASVTALISNIKALRTDWTIYWDELETLTKTVDPLFNTEFTGNLRLTEVRFSSENVITVSGETLTDDTKNFTLVSDLIDAYEASDYFKNAEDRSFTKKDEELEEDTTYIGSFRITMELE